MKTNTFSTSGANAGIPLEDLARLVDCVADDLLRSYLMALLALLTQLTHEMFPLQTSSLDTTRIPVCHTIRIGSSRLRCDPRSRGCVPSKRVSFDGLK